MSNSSSRPPGPDGPLLLAVGVALLVGLIALILGSTRGHPAAHDNPGDTGEVAWPTENRATAGGLSPNCESSTYYLNSEALIHLEAPDGWRRLDYVEGGLVSFVSPKGTGNVKFTWHEAPSAPLEEAGRLPTKFGEYILATTAQEAEPFAFHEVSGVKLRRTYETSEELGAMQGVRVVLEKVLLPWRGGVLSAAWSGYSEPPSDLWEDFLTEGLQGDREFILSMAGGCSPIRHVTEERWDMRAVMDGRVVGGGYSNYFLGVTFQIPAGLQRNPDTNTFEGPNGALTLLALREPLGQPLAGFLTRLHPQSVDLGELERFEFVGRQAASLDYTQTLQGVDYATYQFMVRDQDVLLIFLYVGLNTPTTQRRFEALVKSVAFVDNSRKPTPAGSPFKQR